MLEKYVSVVNKHLRELLPLRPGPGRTSLAGHFGTELNTIDSKQSVGKERNYGSSKLSCCEAALTPVGKAF